MAKLTKTEFNEMQKAAAPPREPTEKDMSDMIAKVHSWQQSEKIHAWDEESLIADLGISIQNFTMAGENKDGDPIEVEFRRPLDEDVKFQGVAYGFRLTMVQEDPPFYNLQRYTQSKTSEAPEESEASEESE